MKLKRIPLDRLARACLYNWMGYGKIDSPVWFVGTEEGGAEIWRHETTTLAQSLLIRKDFALTMDFVDVWEEKYQIPLNTFKGPSVWRFIAAFLLAKDKMAVNTDSVADYVFRSKKLGRSHSDHFICELMPLPKPRKDEIYPYGSVWSDWTSYYDEVAQRRFDLIQQTLLQSPRCELIVSYESYFSELLLESHKWTQIEQWNWNKQQYSFYNIGLTGTRDVHLLTTPFFGRTISYDGLKYSVRKLVL